MKKIMFNDKYCLTQAVLEGRKTMTRRIVPNKLIEKYDEWRSDVDCIALPANSSIETLSENLIKYAPYKLGEVVAIAQSYKDSGYDSDSLDRHPKELSVRGLMKDSAGWNNKMFVKAYACKHHIKIANVKVERLQDISDEDCLKEGVELNTRQYECDGTQYYCVRGLGHWRAIGCTNFDTPRDAFSALIDKVSGEGTWESNPYVWVYEFKVWD